MKICFTIHTIFSSAITCPNMLNILLIESTVRDPYPSLVRYWTLGAKMRLINT